MTVLFTLGVLSIALMLLGMSHLNNSYGRSPRDRALPPGDENAALRVMPPDAQIAPPSRKETDGLLGDSLRKLEEKLSELTQYIAAGGGKKDSTSKLKLAGKTLTLKL